jgi:hypothetical protein
MKRELSLLEDWERWAFIQGVWARKFCECCGGDPAMDWPDGTVCAECADGRCPGPIHGYDCLFRFGPGYNLTVDDKRNDD